MSPTVSAKDLPPVVRGLEPPRGSDAILAAMDMGAAPGVISHRDNGMNVQLQALGKIHAQKVRILMRSIAELKKKLAIATAQGKDHRRSAMIRAMRTRLREQELVVDVVKEELGEKGGMGKEEVNDWVIRKTVGGPLRFRPKTREELQNELYRLEKKHRQAQDKLKARRTGGAGVGPETESNQWVHEEEEDRRSHPEAVDGIETKQGVGGGRREQSTIELMRLSEALEEADALRVSVRSRDAALQAQMEAVDQLQVENRELRGVQERLGRKERRARELKKKNAELGEQHTKLLEDYETSQEQIHHLEAQLELRKEEAISESDAFQEQSLRQAEEVGVLLKREEELTTALEEEAAARERERREYHHSARQAISRAEAAEKAQHEAAKQGRRLRETNVGMAAELQRLGKEAAEAAGLRERGRELAREVKRLSQEGLDRQRRLEEARERGATAEESLRASQESLKGEKLSKDCLIQEANDTKSLLSQETVLLHAEKTKVAEEVEVRQRLESLLASEKSKEEEKGRVAMEAAAATAATAADAAASALAAAKEREAQAVANSPSESAQPDAGVLQAVGGVRERDVSESHVLIEEMESELGEQADQIVRLEQEKHNSELQHTAVVQEADEFRARVAAEMQELQAELDAAREEALSRKEDEPRVQPRSPRLQPSVSAEETERKLKEKLADAKAAELNAKRELEQLKSELDDAKASCELHKTRVKTLVDGQLSAQMTGEVGAEDPYRSSEDTECSNG